MLKSLYIAFFSLLIFQWNFSQDFFLTTDDPTIISKGDLKTKIYKDKDIKHLYIKVQFDIKDHLWHSYWVSPGQFGVAPKIHLNSIKDYDIIYEAPTYHQFDTFISYIYKNNQKFLIKIPIIHEKNISITGRIEWFLCSDELGCFRFPNKNININKQLKDIPFIDDEKTFFKDIPKNIHETSLNYSFKIDNKSIKIIFKKIDKRVANNISIFIKNLPRTYPLHSISKKHKNKTLIINIPKDKLNVKTLNIVLKNNNNLIEKNSNIHSVWFNVNTYISSFSFTFLLYLFLIFIGGIILNFMPCVLPVLSLKIMKFQNQTNNPSFKKQLYFFLGVWSTLITFALIIVIFKNLGNSIGWGFQFQNPFFVIALVFIFLFILLNFFHITHIPIYLPTFINNHYSNEYFYGIILTLSSTPCLAPLLSSTISYALGVSYIHIILLFTSMSLGFSLPLILIEKSPTIRKWIQQSKIITTLLKYLIPTLLSLTIIWLIYLLIHLTSIHILFSLLSTLIFLILFLTISPHKKKYKILLLMLSIIFSLFLVYSTHASETESEETFNPKIIQKMLSQKKEFVLEFTADWCLTCKIIEKTVLETPKVEQFLNKNNIPLIKVDWTKKNEDISLFIKQLGRSGIPLIVYYNEEGRYFILPDVLTPNIFINFIKKHD